MSYALSRSLGTVDPWDHVWSHALSTDDVFVLRLTCSGVKLREPQDALLFARAVGQGQNLQLDVRGVAVWPSDAAAADQTTVDIVLTTSVLRIAVLWADDAQAMAAKVAGDESLRRLFPNLAVVSAQFGRLTEPADAIDHWRSQGMLWDHALPGAKNLGGPSDLFSQPGEYNIVRGQADDGKRATPWVVAKSPLGPVGAPSSFTVAGVGIGAAALILMLSSNQKSRRS